MAASSGVASRNISTAGTTKVSVIRCSSISRSTSAGSMSRRMTECPPRDIPHRAHPVPPMWKSGMATSETVSAPMWKTRSASVRMHGDVPARDHDALGQAGGPRGVELGDHVVGARLEPGVGRLGAAAGVPPLGELGRAAPSGARRSTRGCISLTAAA